MFGRKPTRNIRRVERSAAPARVETRALPPPIEKPSTPVVHYKPSIVPESVPLFATRPLKLGECVLGSNAVVWMAGPRIVKSAEQMVLIGGALQRLGVKFIRSKAVGARDSRGKVIGANKQALRLLAATASRFELSVISEIYSAADLKCMLQSCDVIEVGPQNIENTELLAALGGAGAAVLLNRSPLMPVDRYLEIVREVERAGSQAILLADNGVYGFDSNGDTVLDLSAIVTLKRESSHPVFINAASLARDWTFVESIAAAALGAGVDGVMVDLTCRQSPVDARAAKEILPRELKPTMKKLEALKITLNALVHMRPGDDRTLPQ